LFSTAPKNTVVESQKNKKNYFSEIFHTPYAPAAAKNTVQTVEILQISRFE